MLFYFSYTYIYYQYSTSQSNGDGSRRIDRFGVMGNLLEVFLGLGQLGSRFVGQGPHDHGGSIFIPADEL